MMMLKKFGSESVDKAKSIEVAEALAKVTKKIQKDPSFVAQIEANPAKALADAGFPAGGIKTFRLLDGVSTKDSCSCSCFPVSCGTGVGCNVPASPGSSSYSH